MSLDQELARHLDMLEGYMQYLREEEYRHDEVWRFPVDRKARKLWFANKRKYWCKRFQQQNKQLTELRPKGPMEAFYDQGDWS